MTGAILLASTWWSFGRDRKLLAQAVDLLEANGAAVHDVWADPDLNRTLIAFSAVEETVASSLCEVADEILPSIDLRRHSGSHPRTGALDLARITALTPGASGTVVVMDFAEHLATAHEVPVYVDGPDGLAGSEGRILELHAAGYGGLIDRKLTPDFGPPLIHERYGVATVVEGPLQPQAALEIQDPTCRVAGDVARTLSELRADGDPLLLGVQADGFAQPTRDGSLLLLTFELLEQLDPDRVLKVAEKEAKLLGAAPGRARALGLWMRSDLPRASRLTLNEQRQVWEG